MKILNHCCVLLLLFVADASSVAIFSGGKYDPFKLNAGYCSTVSYKRALFEAFHCVHNTDDNMLITILLTRQMANVLVML